MFIFNFRKPYLMIVILNLLGYAVLSLMTPELKKELMVIGLIVTFVLLVSYGIINKMSLRDGYIFLIVAVLFSIGEIMLCRIDQDQGTKQLIWFLLSILCFFVVYVLMLKINIWEKFGYLYYFAAVGLFLVTLVFGTTSGGSKNWIVIGNISFQPSELAKILAIFFLASRYKNPLKYKIRGINEDIVCSAMIYSMLGFLVLQREWGTAVLLFLIHISLMYVFSSDRKIMFLNCVFAVLGGLLGFKFVDHIKVRVDVWLDPWTDIAGKGYQITQSLFAIGSGGFFGTGIGLGSPEYIPEVHSDFIFSAICEEFGIMGGIAVIMLYFILIYRGIRIAMTLENTFYKCIASGISIMIGFQTFIILGGVTKFIPLTGITLPFISYGGSSLLTSFIAIAVLEAVANKIEAHNEEEADTYEA